MASAMTQKPPGSGFRKIPGFRFGTPPRRDEAILSAQVPASVSSSTDLQQQQQEQDQKYYPRQRLRQQQEQESGSQGGMFTRLTNSVRAAVAGVSPLRGATSSQATLATDSSTTEATPQLLQIDMLYPTEVHTEPSVSQSGTGDEQPSVTADSTGKDQGASSELSDTGEDHEDKAPASNTYPEAASIDGDADSSSAPPTKPQIVEHPHVPSAIPKPETHPDGEKPEPEEHVTVPRVAPESEAHPDAKMQSLEHATSEPELHLNDAKPQPVEHLNAPGDAFQPETHPDDAESQPVEHSETPGDAPKSEAHPDVAELRLVEHLSAPGDAPESEAQYDDAKPKPVERPDAPGATPDSKVQLDEVQSPQDLHEELPVNSTASDGKNQKNTSTRSKGFFCRVPQFQFVEEPTNDTHEPEELVVKPELDDTEETPAKSTEDLEAEIERIRMEMAEAMEAEDFDKCSLLKKTRIKLEEELKDKRTVSSPTTLDHVEDAGADEGPCIACDVSNEVDHGLSNDGTTDPQAALTEQKSSPSLADDTENELAEQTPHLEEKLEHSEEIKAENSIEDQGSLDQGPAFREKFAASAKLAVEKVAASFSNVLPMGQSTVDILEQKSVVPLPGRGNAFRHVPAFKPPRERDEVSIAVVALILDRVLADEIAASSVVMQVVLRVLSTQEENAQTASLLDDFQEDYFGDDQSEIVRKPQPEGEIITHSMLKEFLPAERKANVPELAVVDQPLVCADCGAIFALQETMDAHSCCTMAHEELPDWLRQDLEEAYNEQVDDPLPPSSTSVQMFRGYRWCTHLDVAQASWIGGTDLLWYGEILPRGAARAFARLGQGAPKFMRPALALELGMGRGRIAMQLFLGGASVIGFEMGSDRYARGKTAIERLVSRRPDSFEVVQSNSSNIQIRRCRTSICAPRTFEARYGNFFKMVEKEEVEAATIIVLHVRLPEFCWSSVRSLLSTTTAGCRIVTSEDLRKIWGKRIFPFKLLGPCRASCSWARAEGSVFWLWEREDF